ncbi:hypothetical protein D9M68_767280 [compost metagenome]
MGPGGAVLDDVGNDVLAEVAARAFGGCVATKLFHQEARLEHIDAHGGQRHVRLVRNTRRILGLFDEIDHPVAPVDMHHAKARRFHARHFEAPDGHVSARINVLTEHDFIVHLIDMVARQDDDIARAIVLDDVHVLEDRVGRAGIPHVFLDALARRQHVEALVSLGPQEIPAALQMPDQAVGLILGRHRNAANA